MFIINTWIIYTILVYLFLNFYKMALEITNNDYTIVITDSETDLSDYIVKAQIVKISPTMMNSLHLGGRVGNQAYNRAKITLTLSTGEKIDIYLGNEGSENNVSNQSNWTNDLDGLATAASDIEGWLAPPTPA